jgi:ABC-2 type transport system permease protein
MLLFLKQLGWEFRKLWARPRTWLGFALAFFFEVGVSTLLRMPSARAKIAHDIWKMRAHWQDVFSGVTTATHIMGEAITVIGSLGLALVAGEIMAKESEDGTLRMIFCRPVSRTRVFLQKLIVCAAFAVVLVTFIGASALWVGLVFEGSGPLTMIAPHEGVIGFFNMRTGLQRYALATALAIFTGFSGMLWAFLFSCFKMKPAAAAIVALSLFTADDIIRTQPSLANFSPYCVTTRMLSWRQVFNDEIPWPRIQRNYTQLAWIDLGLVATAWLAFRRREFIRQG